MENMTIAEKAKAYDGALMVAAKFYNANTNEGYRQIFEEIFPVLKERTVSKFNEGDWIVNVNNGKANQVMAVDEDGDGYTLDDDTYFSGSWADMYRLWTIDDARDGDVLVSHETIVLFSNREGPNLRSHFTYHYLNTQWIDVNDLHYSKAYKPATKSEREKLFAIMHDKGYEWDSKNLVLYFK
jgi:hypothetical protein